MEVVDAVLMASIGILREEVVDKDSQDDSGRPKWGLCAVAALLFSVNR
jgi:hypothetical protein